MKKSDHRGVDFDSLRKEGVALLQDLSGKSWTDYNLHDPGVTILEQLCYALTELIYRTGFDVEDYFTNRDGHIDFDYQALYLPEQIYPCQAVTPTDYRKIIFDSIPEIDNVWIKEAAGNETEHSNGLYDILLKLKEVSDQNGKKRIIDRVKEIYCRNRNLCEDLAAVRILDNRYYALHADIEINARRNPADILAEIYFRCSKIISPGIAHHPFNEVLAKRKGLDEILTGPFTGHGYIDDQELEQMDKNINVSDLNREIASIEGVESVNRLFLEKDGKEIFDFIERNTRESAAYLHFPRNDNEILVNLIRKERQFQIPVKEIRSEFDKLDFEYRELRHTAQDISRLYSLPKGRFSHLQQYYSIQEQFPPIYGINSFGIPESFPLARKAQAKQLKAFLLFFEQTMANFLATLQGIPKFFSQDKDLRQSYFYQPLDNSNVPNIEPLYKKRGPALEKAITGMINQYDPFIDRRSRLLDYLLALYGESFSQKSLRHFNYYFTAEGIGREILNNKRELIKNMVAINHRRGGSFNYRKLSWNTDDIPGLKAKVSILLGLKYYHKRSLTIVFIREGLRIISDEQFIRLKEGTMELQIPSFDEIRRRIEAEFNPVPPQRLPERITPEKIRRLFEEIPLFRNNVINESFLRFGFHLHRYRIGSLDSEEGFLIVFKPYEGAEWCYLAKYKEKSKAIESVNILCRVLRRLNILSEGLHIVEHILLRPTTKREYEGLQVPDDFYTFKISVIFPSWTSRFNNKKFRYLAEETVRINCPAHISAEYYWIDFDKMIQFEILYKKWHLEKSKKSEANEALDELSEKLIDFLLKNRKQSHVLFF